jgi:hypothetical protein
MLITRMKLPHYFDTHPITIVSSYGLGEVIQNQGAMGRITKWVVDLMGEGITYASQATIKSQVLTNFVIEWTETGMPLAPVEQEYRTMYFDGSLMKTGAGLIVVSPLGVRLRYMI